MKCIFNFTEAAETFARWRLRYMKSDLILGHIVGIKHQPTNALLRLRTNENDGSNVDEDIPEVTVTKRGQSGQDRFVDNISVRTLIRTP